MQISTLVIPGLMNGPDVRFADNKQKGAHKYGKFESSLFARSYWLISLDESLAELGTKNG